MPNYIKHNGGYSLLVVLLIVTILSIVGLTLMGSVGNSLQFAQVNKQTITNKTTADMAVEEGTAQVEKAVDTINTNISKNSNLTIDDIKTQLRTSLESISSLGNYSYTITHSTINDGSNGGIYVEKVIIDAPLGSSGGHLTKTITISTISNVFKYTTVTPSTLTLNGASYIEGDVSVGSDIQTGNYGRFINGQYYYVPTSYPAIKGSLTILGNYKRLNTYNNSGNSTWTSFSATPANLSLYFSIPPVISNNHLNIDRIAVGGLVTAHNGTLNTGTISKSNQNYSGNYNTTKTFNANSSFSSYLTIGSNGDLTVYGNLLVSDNLTLNSGAKLTVNGNLVVTKNLYMNGTSQITVNNGSLRVNGSSQLSGTLTLNNPNNYIFINGSTNIDGLTLNGTMYINGTADIQNDLDTNGTVYATGDVTVQDLSNSSGGTLVLLTDGNIQLSNNSQFTENPKVINAFFYSNKVLEIFGMWSNIKIVGGIYGNPIILNAVKGKTSQTSFLNSFKINNYYFQKNQDQIDPTTKSRLSIIYQKDLILNPPTGIPTVQQLTVKEVDTTYK